MYTCAPHCCIGGGGVAAGVLTAAGLTVAVVEKGGLFGTADYAAMSEMQGFQSLYEKQGLCTSDDGNVIVSTDIYYYYMCVYILRSTTIVCCKITSLR
jgi:hypothetical protein